MEELNLSEAIKDLEKQIKHQEKRCDLIDKKVIEQKFKDSGEKQSEYLKLSDIKEEALKERDKANKDTFIASMFTSGFSLPCVLFPFFLTNILWLCLLLTGLSFTAFAISAVVMIKKSQKAASALEKYDKACDDYEKLTERKSEKLKVLEMEMDLEYKLLRELRDEYKVLKKYKEKTAPKKIEKAKIEVKKSKSIREAKHDNDDLIK